MCGSVHRGVFSTLGEYHEYIGVLNTSEGTKSAWGGGYHEYIGGYHDGSGGYHEYVEGCSVHQGIS